MRSGIVWLLLVVLAAGAAAAQLRIIRPGPLPAEAPAAPTVRPIPPMQKLTKGETVPLALNDYCVYSLPVKGRGNVSVAVEWAPADTPLEIRLFAPGTQEIRAAARGVKRLEVAAVAGLYGSTPDAPTGDWMIEIRPIVNGPPGVAAGGAGRQTALTRKTLSPAAAVQTQRIRPVALRPPAVKLTPVPAGTPDTHLPKARINGTLTAVWPGMDAAGIVNVTARREQLRLQMQAIRAEMESLRDWQLQWDEAAKAYFLATVAQEDLQDLHSSLQGIIEDLKNVGGRRQEFGTMFEDFDEKANQLLNTLSSVLKSMKEASDSAMRNML